MISLWFVDISRSCMIHYTCFSYSLNYEQRRWLWKQFSTQDNLGDPHSSALNRTQEIDGRGLLDHSGGLRGAIWMGQSRVLRGPFLSSSSNCGCWGSLGRLAWDACAPISSRGMVHRDARGNQALQTFLSNSNWMRVAYWMGHHQRLYLHLHHQSPPSTCNLVLKLWITITNK